MVFNLQFNSNYQKLHLSSESSISTEFGFWGLRWKSQSCSSDTGAWSGNGGITVELWMEKVVDAVDATLWYALESSILSCIYLYNVS